MKRRIIWSIASGLKVQIVSALSGTGEGSEYLIIYHRVIELRIFSSNVQTCQSDSSSSPSQRSLPANLNNKSRSYNLISMKINEVKISNFKGIDSLNFSPKMINVIVGRNNAGKTSILEAVNTVLSPSFIERNYPRDPASVIHYLSFESDVSLSVSNERNRRLTVRMSRLSPEEVIEKLLQSAGNEIGWFKSRSVSDLLSKVLSRDIGDVAHFKDMSDVQLQELVKNTLQSEIAPETRGNLDSWKRVSF